MQKDVSLTPAQQLFATQHHGLLLKFMCIHGLDDDYYGMLAERYVKTVKTYLETDALHGYAFSTILWYRLKSDLNKERRRERRAIVPCSIEGVSEFVGKPDDFSGSLLWEEIESVITHRQAELLRLRAIGFSPGEIARIQNCSGNAIHCRLKRIKLKLRSAGIL